MGIFFLALHFTFVISYCLPRKAESKLQFYSRVYIYPFFHQSWSLFVPPPDSNYHLYAEYEHNGNHRTDIFEEILVQHQENRIKGYGPLVIAMVNSIHYFEKNTKLRSRINGPVQNDLYFKILEHAALNYLKYTHRVELVHVRIRLVVDDLPSKTSRIYFN